MATDLDIFLNAPEEASPERINTYLDDACAGDSALRIRVEALFAADGETEAIADHPPRMPGGPTPATSHESEGTLIGPYKLLQKIGEGGFGTVYMAAQLHPVKRRVALKIIRGGMDTRQVIARFEAERQALVMMDHPNIAKVLDAGATESGRPYFVMELVRGVPITEFCRQQKFGPRRRLELFRDVCSAVNHAHQKGIIHRALKPSNVMVTLAADVPEVRVIDFGIAKVTQSSLTDKTLFTLFEQFLGTPVYMSPEQAAMSAIDVDTRSDIYSLGVLLYELLAGVPPFDPKTLLSAGYDEMRRIIAEDEPPAPSIRLTQARAKSGEGPPGASETTPSALKRDLDWIVMKAIEKDRARRYETANAFLADIERYLTDQPVVAAAPSATYKFRKFARRNKAAMGVAAAMVILLLAGIATTSWQAVRANAEAKRANEAETVAIRRLEDAQRARQASEIARLESDEARQEAEDTSAFIVEMIQSADPDGAGQGRGLEMTVARALEIAVRKLDTDLIGQPDRRAKLQSVIGEIYNHLGLHREAIPLLEEACAHRKREFGPRDQSLIPLLGSLATAYRHGGKPQEAVGIQEAHLELCLKFHGRLSLSTTTSMFELSRTYQQVGREKDASELAEASLRASEAYAAKLNEELGLTHAQTNKSNTHGPTGCAPAP